MQINELRRKALGTSLNEESKGLDTKSKKLMLDQSERVDKAVKSFGSFEKQISKYLESGIAEEYLALKLMKLVASVEDSMKELSRYLNVK